MSARVVAQLARTTGRVQCSRCFDLVDVTAGRWRAAESDATHVAICDRCAEASDPAGYAALLAWRRAARPTAISTGISPRAPWAS